MSKVVRRGSEPTFPIFLDASPLLTRARKHCVKFEKTSPRITRACARPENSDARRRASSSQSISRNGQLRTVASLPVLREVEALRFLLLGYAQPDHRPDNFQDDPGREGAPCDRGKDAE